MNAFIEFVPAQTYTHRASSFRASFNYWTKIHNDSFGLFSRNEE